MEGVIETMNEGAEKIFGYKKEELNTLSLDHLLNQSRHRVSLEAEVTRHTCARISLILFLEF